MILKKRLLALSRRNKARIRKNRYMDKMRCLLINRRSLLLSFLLFFFQAEDGIRDVAVTGVQTCALPISDETRPGNAARACLLDHIPGWLLRPISNLTVSQVYSPRAREQPDSTPCIAARRIASRSNQKSNDPAWPITGLPGRCKDGSSTGLKPFIQVSHPNICRVHEIHTAPTDRGEVDF